MLDAAAAGAVGGEARVAGDARDRADVDDAAVRRAGSCARATAWATKNVPRRFVSSDRVPIVPGDLDGRLADVAAGVVHEDVDVAERGLSRVGHAGECSPRRARRATDRRRGRRGARISAANSSVSSFRRAVMIKSAPASASARPKYCPRPRLAPVTSATRPLKSKKFFTMGFERHGQVEVRSQKFEVRACSTQSAVTLYGFRSTFMSPGSCL